ncbi:unnamed protein product (macronuclear) [Paramecium tetraurelia]|uniref:FYVE-type domain-containing protein n=1 Tax=Paramecium tetraurelia TaxID=5888 RepID=A0CQB3_PARTE|nr:uncharacterized protein GSPATT00009328001 [Paramecium tetraurelia]CAK72980.1 unnamed protein product [Paramecium tetraurelia]|eukprot:XP_001440377.1 hypothetical protein (macronuclear) [Paramecium tetraurelia strain d4-2]
MLEKIGSKFTYKTFVGSSTNKNEVCELCNQTFDWKHKQHQCKRCLRYVCYNCAPDKAIIASHDLKTPHRICKNCKDDSKHQTQQMEVEKCKFGHLSGIGKRWAYLAQGDDFAIDKAQEEYQKSLSQILKNASNETKNQIQTNLQRYFKENKKTLNYSLYEWNYKMCVGEQEISLLTKISNVLHCFFQTNPIKLTRNLVFITTYILYFCDEAICLLLLLFLHQKVLPSRFQYHKLDVEENKPIDQEVKFLLDCITEQSNSKIDSLLRSKLKVFLDTYSSDILTTLMFNHIEFYVGYFLFNQLLINREFSIYEKFLANICLELQKVIAEVQIDEIPHQIMKNIQLEQLTTFLQMEDTQKRKYRTSLTSKEQLPQQSSNIITQQQSQVKKEEQQQQRQSSCDNALQYLLDSFIGFLKDNQHSKIEYMIQNEKYDSNKNQIKELYQAIKRQNEELSGLRNSISYAKQDQDLEYDANNSRISRSSVKLDDPERTFFQRELQEKSNLIKELEEKVSQQKELIQRYIDQQQQSEMDNYNTVSSLKAQLSNNNQMTADNKEIQTKAFEQKEENYRNQISNLHSEISGLKFEINNLQIQLQQNQKNKTEFENQLKEKINSEYEQEVYRLTEDRVSLLKKTSFLQQQNSFFTVKLEEKEQETQELKKQLEEQKKNTEEMRLLYAKQNEQSDKLNKHIDDLNVQILGLKRKEFDQNNNQTNAQTHNQTSINKELQENNIQIRNNLLHKEKELFNLKQKFVEVNQLKIEYFDQMQSYERINKEINQSLKQYEGQEIHQLKSFYEEKISLLESTHEEQMNRLLSQFQQNQPYQLEQQTTNQHQYFKESQPNQEKQIIDEQQQEQSVTQTDDCTIF